MDTNNNSQTLTIISSESLIFKQVSAQQQQQSFKYSKYKKPLLKNSRRSQSAFSCSTQKLTIYGHKNSESEESEDDYKKDLRKNRKQVYSRAQSFLRIYNLLISIFASIGRMLQQILSIFCYPFSSSSLTKKKLSKYHRLTPPQMLFKQSSTLTDIPSQSTLNQTSTLTSTIPHNNRSYLSHHLHKKQKIFPEDKYPPKYNNIQSNSTSLIDEVPSSCYEQSQVYEKEPEIPSEHSFALDNSNINSNNLALRMKVYDQHTHNLVLDLDETLIYCSEKALSDEAETLTVSMPEGTKHYYLHKRQYLQEFLNECAELFNIYIFTAATREYAEEVVKMIDPTGLIKRIYSRQQCFFDGKQLNKSLTSIDLDLNKTVMIDNSPACVANNAANALQIADYRAETQDDYQLMRFSQLLKRLVTNQPENFPKYLSQISRI